MYRGRESYITDYTYHNKVMLIRGGAGYFSKLEQIINEAVYTIHFQMYIFEEDATGKRIAKALIQAAERGVGVYLLLDGYASQHLSKEFINEFKKAGINFSYFRPLFSSKLFYVGRRLHYKVVVVDAIKSLVGGLNVGDRYNDTSDSDAWLDWAVYSEGEISERLDMQCNDMWEKNVLKKYKPEYIPVYDNSVKEECVVRIRKNDWLMGRTEITQAYMDMFVKAGEHITILTSYFWPSARLLKKMKKAARRGVKIRLILSGRSDVIIAKYAERHMYHWLFKNKISVYEYQGNVLHGKLATYDDKWVTVGSYNVNNISAYASIELNLEIKDMSFAQIVSSKLHEIINNDAAEITQITYNSNYNFFNRMVHAVSYRIVHMIFLLFTFFFKHGNYDT